MKTTCCSRAGEYHGRMAGCGGRRRCACCAPEREMGCGIRTCGIRKCVFLALSWRLNPPRRCSKLPHGGPRHRPAPVAPGPADFADGRAPAQHQAAGAIAVGPASAQNPAARAVPRWALLQGTSVTDLDGRMQRLEQEMQALWPLRVRGLLPPPPPLAAALAQARRGSLRPSCQRPASACLPLLQGVDVQGELTAARGSIDQLAKQVALLSRDQEVRRRSQSATLQFAGAHCALQCTRVPASALRCWSSPQGQRRIVATHHSCPSTP